MSLTRRAISKLAVGAAFSGVAAPASAFFHKRKQPTVSIADRLIADLNGTLKPGCGGAFSIVEFGRLERSDGKFHLAAVIRLDWPPGYRIRRYDAIEPSENDAYLKLLLEAYEAFRKAWPDCVL